MSAHATAVGGVRWLHLDDPHAGGLRLLFQAPAPPAPALRMIERFSPAFARAPLARKAPGRSGSGFAAGRRTMLATLRSSTAIRSHSRTSRVVCTSIQFRRRSATFW